MKGPDPISLFFWMVLSSLIAAQDLYNIDTVRTGYLNFYDSHWQTALDSYLLFNC